MNNTYIIYISPLDVKKKYPKKAKEMQVFSCFFAQTHIIYNKDELFQKVFLIYK